MSLFERIQSKRYDLQEERKIKKKFFNKNKNKNKLSGGFEDVTGENIKKGDYPKTRKELEAKRKYYEIDPKTNQPSKAGIEKYARKNKQLSSGSNIPVELTQADLDKAKRNMVGGRQIKNKKGDVIGTTTGKLGGRLAGKRSKNAKSYKEIMADINKKNPVIQTPVGPLPKTAANMKKFSKRKRVMNFAKNLYKKGATRFGKLPLKGKAAVIAGAGLAAVGIYQGARKLLSPATLDMNKDFTKTAPIKYGSASKASDRPKGKNIGDNVRFQYARSDNDKIKDKAGPYLKKDQLDKFKSGKYTVSTKSGQQINVADRLKNSAFAQQVKKARQRNNKKDQAFLKSVKNSSVVKGL